MIDEVNAGKTIFYDFYSPQAKSTDASKENAGLLFFRGNPGAPFTVICPGGGFSYVGSLHAGFPIAVETAKKGYNAFVLKYRTGGAQRATEDLAAAITFIYENAETLAVSRDGYSVWGGSAGARMAAAIGTDGIARYGGGDNVPKPAMVVIAYTGHFDYSSDDPPTFTMVGENDGIASPATMERRVNALRNVGVDVEFHLYPGIGHGFALGTGTIAEGWLDLAIRFWKKHITK
jgi:acetyl esterase/lipase